MLFNSYEFLLFFLPVSLAGFFMLGRYGKPVGAGWLAACSLFFYGWWDYRYVFLLMGSIVGNYLAGSYVARTTHLSVKKSALISAIIANIALLGYYKYAGFFIETVNRLDGGGWVVPVIALPLGISFFTFTQIAFLVDAYRGIAREYRFSYYVLFVTYFPHLIAGPVLHHKEMMPQFDLDRNYKPRRANFEIGLTIFVIGMAKKVLLADNLAPYANFVFGSSEPQSLFLAWGGALAYTFQLYFDFSGYSDMAIGISRMFGIRLPLNFHSPYKSINIIEFWRRWHMTLSRFLRDYLYFALGGNRAGVWRRHVNLLVTMLLGGLWHGAGWNFVLWGGLHGAYLIVNHGWRAHAIRANWALPRWLAGWAPVGLTFFCVVIAWVFFRAQDLSTALRLLAGMFGANGVALPQSIVSHLGFAQVLLEKAGITTFFGGGERFVMTYLWLMVAASIAFFMPNTQQLMRRFVPALAHGAPDLDTSTRLVWKPRMGWAVATGVLASVCLMSLGKPSEFLYFQF